MQRDMDLVRQILLELEKAEHGFVFDNPEIEGYSSEVIAYHVYLMHEAGLVRAVDITTADSASPEYEAAGLTWSGHEFIEASRQPALWAQAKEIIAKAGGGSFALWQSVLTDIVKKSLGL